MNGKLRYFPLKGRREWEKEANNMPLRGWV